MVDETLRQMLRDLGRALSAAMECSPEVGKNLRRIHSEGYCLSLVLDCKRSEATAAASGSPSSQPVFRINGEDLSFLKSIGIDPTRRRRRAT